MKQPGMTWRTVLTLSMLALMTGITPVFAALAGELQPIRGGVAHDMLFDLAFEGRRGIAVGSYGSILTSDDGGAAWHPAEAVGGRMALLGTAISGGRCLAVGQGGTILVAADCRNWQAAESGSGERLMAVGLNAAGLSYVVGAFGTVLRSTDGGLTWSAVELDWTTLSPSGGEPHLYDVHVDADGSITLVGEFGLILRSADGARWRVVHSGEQSLFGLSVTGTTVYAVGQGGVVLASDDRGERWRRLATGTAAILTGVWGDGKDRVVATGLNAVLQSNDNGQSWRKLDAGPYSQATHMALAASATVEGEPRVFVVGSSAMVLALQP